MYSRLMSVLYTLHELFGRHISSFFSDSAKWIESNRSRAKPGARTGSIGSPIWLTHGLKYFWMYRLCTHNYRVGVRYCIQHDRSRFRCTQKVDVWVPYLKDQNRDIFQKFILRAFLCFTVYRSSINPILSIEHDLNQSTNFIISIILH